MSGVEICLRGENKMFVNNDNKKRSQTYTGNNRQTYTFSFIAQEKSANPADQDRNRRANFAQKSLKIDLTRKPIFVFFGKFSHFS